MPSISSIHGRIVFNSRGSKSIEIDVVTDGKFIGRACAPSGASVGKFEAQSFPENKPEEALSMLNANINRFVGLQAEDLLAVYNELKSIDKTDNYSKIGGSVAYALSIAAVDSAATRKVIESIDKRFTYGKGDEGAWAPNVNNDQALEIIEKAVNNCGYTLGKDMAIGIDFASSSFWNEEDQLYDYARQGIKRDTGEQIEFANRLIHDYKLIYAEDPVHEGDFESMAVLNKKNPKTLITGDDMLVTNTARIREAVRYGACSGAILKVNQAGSLYEALDFAKECNKNNIKIITSHRSGESVDSHISHIAIATSSSMLKSGVLGGERIAKLNELVRLIEYDLVDGMQLL
jgi:enolase